MISYTNPSHINGFVKLPQAGDLLPHGARVVSVSYDYSSIYVVSDMGIDFYFDENEYPTYADHTKDEFSTRLEWIGMVSSVALSDLIHRKITQD